MIAKDELHPRLDAAEKELVNSEFELHETIISLAKAEKERDDLRTQLKDALAEAQGARDARGVLVDIQRTIQGELETVTKELFEMTSNAEGERLKVLETERELDRSKIEFETMVDRLLDQENKTRIAEERLKRANETIDEVGDNRNYWFQQYKMANDDSVGAVGYVEYARNAIRWHCGCLSLPSDTENLDNWLKAHKERIANDE